MKNEKGDVGSISTSKAFNLFASKQKLFSLDYAEKQVELQSNLVGLINPSPKVLRLYHCFGCERNFAAKKMSNCLIICRDCYWEATRKGRVARTNFVEKTIRNFQKYLRRRVDV